MHHAHRVPCAHSCRYLDWLDQSNGPSHCKVTLLHLDTLWEGAINGFVSVFGPELYSGRVKVALHAHVSRSIRWHGTLRYHSDELHLETSHLRGVKEPWRHTNHKKPEAQMARYVARRDVLELLRDRYLEQTDSSGVAGAAGATTDEANGTDEDDAADVGAGAPGAACAARQRQNQLMCNARANSRTYELRASLDELSKRNSQLTQLRFATRQFLFLDGGGNGEAAAVYFPQLDSDSVQLRPGVHLYERLDDPRVRQGGCLLHANLLQKDQLRIFVAVESEDAHGTPITYYAQLLLCFTAHYLSEQVPLCYVQWLHTASAVALELRRRPTSIETRGPFEAYRWAVYPRGRAGHPAQGGPWYGVVNARKIMFRVHMVHSMHDNTLFRLSTDVWLQYL